MAHFRNLETIFIDHDAPVLSLQARYTNDHAWSLLRLVCNTVGSSCCCNGDRFLIAWSEKAFFDTGEKLRLTPTKNDPRMRFITVVRYIGDQEPLIEGGANRIVNPEAFLDLFQSVSLIVFCPSALLSVVSFKTVQDAFSVFGFKVETIADIEKAFNGSNGESQAALIVESLILGLFRSISNTQYGGRRRVEYSDDEKED